MPCDFVFHKQLGLVVTRFRGRIEDAELLGLYRSLFEAVDFEPWLQEIADARFIEQPASAEAVKRSSDLIRARLEGLGSTYRTTVIAPAEATYGLSRMYGILASSGPHAVSVYRTVEDAAESLALAADDLERLLASPRPERGQ
jgi:hypothetical protein